MRFDEEGCGIDLKKEHLLLRKESGFEEYMLLRGERFELRLFKVRDRVKVFTEGKLQVLTCVRGDVTLKSKSNTSNAELSLTPMETVLVPACVETIEMEGEGEVLCANFINV
ncbi:hypothetical protein ES705_38047 [subsurface metagenome]